MFSYFTVANANEALPKVIEKYKALKKQKLEVERLEAKLNSQMSISFNLAEYAAIKRELNSAVTKFYQAVEDLENTGVVLKSLEEGLLDFPSKRFDDEVWLCWKEGETEIKFWHEKDVGFMGRKPLSVSDESLV
ncbi:MAG: DUF2203 domain-containing protein [Candidatus Nitrosotenuis sp.]|uniref:DUF2203 domain-containing protein n=1 Tax=Candidatus Nitrosotenuis uzonensis TaxID=1407055 RepID=V6AT71_9ARCH|nr:DUF2203 domain-containing protein [Candidatus Nitrosotenuis uzonensis]CAE6498611.1 conserved hypothetical protein [Candidatus Nitrosotenuis uzonensis]CDI05715.1 conserved hypothetical protein [Candidatus Nitrosotenuis uzonensis]